MILYTCIPICAYVNACIQGGGGMDTEIYKTLSDESRLRILNLLMQKELCVCEIEAVLDMSQSNVSRHLNKLKNSGIVISKKKLQWVFCSVNNDFFEDNNHLYEHLKDTFGKDVQLLEDINKLNILNNQESICNKCK